MTWLDEIEARANAATKEISLERAKAIAADVARLVAALRRIQRLDAPPILEGMARYFDAWGRVRLGDVDTLRAVAAELRRALEEI